MTNIMIIQYNIYISFSFGPWLKTWYEAYHIWFRDNIATASFACMRSCVVANLASLYPAVFASHELLTRFTPISTMITLWCPAIHPRPTLIRLQRLPHRLIHLDIDTTQGRGCHDAIHQKTRYFSHGVLKYPACMNLVLQQLDTLAMNQDIYICLLPLNSLLFYSLLSILSM